jgi:hypothetical protein
MNSERDFDQVAAEWLNEGSDATPPRLIEAVLLAVRSTPQERGFGIPWRIQSMSHFAYVATVVAVLAVVVAAAFYAFSRGPSVGPGPTPCNGPGPTPSIGVLPSPGQMPRALGPVPSGWTTYTSPQYGFTVAHPTDWSVRPAERAWDLARDVADCRSPAMDDFIAPGGDLRVSIWSLPVDGDLQLTPDGTSYGLGRIEPWIQAYCDKAGRSACAGFLNGAVALCIEARDCHPGLLVGVVAPFDQDVQAFFTGGHYGDRMVIVTVWHTADDPILAPYGGGRQLIEGFLGSMCVTTVDARRDFPC